MVDGLAQEVEREKMKAIGARNLLKSIAREREAQKQQLQALLVEKKMELERYVLDTHHTSSCHILHVNNRLRVQHESLQQVEQQQMEFTEDFGLK